MLDTRLPLLEKEFIEQAVRKRTYIMRIIAAAAFFCFYGVFYLTDVDPTSFAAIGSGENLFELTTVIQFGAVYIFIPILMAGTIAYERERESLDLLRLTALRSWQIVLEKYLSRMIPGVSLLLLVLPLHAVSYTLGGVRSMEIVNAFAASLLLAFQVGAYAIMVSAYCRTATRALLVSFVGYGCLLVFFLFDPFDTVDSALQGLFQPMIDCWENDEVHYLRHGLQITALLGLAWLFLAFPRLRLGFLIQRALERQRPAGSGEQDLPDHAPIRWMERRRSGVRRWTSSWGGRIVYGLLVAVALFVVYFKADSKYQRDDELLTLYLLVWGVAAICLGTVCSNLFNSERGNQTLDVLLTTGLTPKEIIAQKAGTIAEFRRVFGWALLLMVGCRWLFVNHIVAEWSLHLRYVIFSSLGIWIFLSLAGWVALLIGLCIPHRMQALGTTLGILVTWNLAPFIFFLVFEGRALHPFAAVSYLSPMFTMIMIEQPASAAGHFGDGGAMIFYLMSIAFGFSLLYLIRKFCLERAEKFLCATALET